MEKKRKKLVAVTKFCIW